MTDWEPNINFECAQMNITRQFRATAIFLLELISISFTHSPDSELNLQTETRKPFYISLPVILNQMHEDTV